MATEIDAGLFLSSVRPLLEKRDVHGLTCLLNARWTADQITALLFAKDDEDARKVAACCLALVGERGTIESVAAQLKDPDKTVNEMAEHALWSIWFRCGTPEANIELCRGTKALDDRQFAQAMEHLDRAIELDEDFAEAYNQRAIAHYLQEHYEESARECLEAVKRMPCHFGAWAGMGHCHLHLGRLKKALKCYEKALEINPHLECVHQTAGEVRKQLQLATG